MARPLKIAWNLPAEVFYQLYRQGVEARMAKRWQALGMLRRWERFMRVKEMGGSPSRFSRYSGLGMVPYGFSRGEGGGEGGAAASISLPYSSELNPAERVLEEVRRWIEGRRYERI